MPGGNPYPGLIPTVQPLPLRVLLQAGHRDLNWDQPESNWLAENLRTAAALAEAGYDVRLVLGDGGHSANHGGVLLPDALRWVWRAERPGRSHDLPRPRRRLPARHGCARGREVHRDPPRRRCPVAVGAPATATTSAASSSAGTSGRWANLPTRRPARPGSATTTSSPSRPTSPMPASRPSSTGSCRTARSWTSSSTVSAARAARGSRPWPAPRRPRPGRGDVSGPQRAARPGGAVPLRRARGAHLDDARGFRRPRLVVRHVRR